MSGSSFDLWKLFKWSFSLPLLLKAFLQNWHLCFLILSCTTKTCFLRYSLLLKTFLQRSHSWVILPWTTWTCVLQFCLWLNCLLHVSHLNSFWWSPWILCKWSFKEVRFVNFLSHKSHSKSLILHGFSFLTH